jgi:hypothetical protein
MISDKLDSGSFGSIYTCVDLEKPHNSLVIKISDNYNILGIEIEALIEIRSKNKHSDFTYPYEYFPKCLTKGMFLLDVDQTVSKKNVSVS